jgi:hypothetical protein
MSILDFLYHRHYWSLPHRRDSDNRIIQICYDCGRERQSPLIIAGSKPETGAADDKKKAQHRLELNLDQSATGATEQTT